LQWTFFPKDSSLQQRRRRILIRKSLGNPSLDLTLCELLKKRLLLPSSLAVTSGLIFVNTTHPFEEFLRIGPTDFLSFGSLIIAIAITGADGLGIPLLPFKLSNHLGCHSVSPFFIDAIFQ